MRFAVWPLPAQPFTEVVALAQHAEATGWDGVWFADHFMPNTQEAAGDTLECWAAVTALAALVPRVTIGTLVCGNTYRHPAVLANQAAAVDVISGGRLVLGIGAGWQENEHRKYSI
ncbi:MAG TPA: LLM class flavin-dependent oxidoreductase, partial [Nitriliruptorales bacterium]